MLKLTPAGKRVLLDALVFQIAWLICVLGGVTLALIITLANLVLHLHWLQANRSFAFRWLVYILICSLIGIGIDQLAIYAGFLKLKLHQSILKITFWGMFVLFLFNTIGNLLALNNLETIIFTPLTALLSLFSLRLALANQLPKQQKPN